LQSGPKHILAQGTKKEKQIGQGSDRDNGTGLDQLEKE
jgi:hypothetical protein